MHAGQGLPSQDVNITQTRRRGRVMQTTATADVIALLQAEVSQLQEVMAGFDSAAWSRPSACAGWTVGDVMAHLIQGASSWCDVIARAVAGDTNPPPGQQALRPGERGSELTAQRAVAFRQESRRYRPAHSLYRGIPAITPGLAGLARHGLGQALLPSSWHIASA